MADETPDRSMLAVAASVWGRRKWLAILTAAAVLTAAVALLVALPNIYQSTVTVVVDRHHVPDAFVKSPVTSELEPRLHTVSQDILSRARLLELVQRFGLYEDMRRRASEEDVVERMRRDISFELKTVERKGNEGTTTVAFTLAYRGRDPRTVADVTNTLASFYIAENVKSRERQATATAELLKNQLQETRRKLEAQEERVAGFRKRYVGALPQQAMSNLLMLERLHADLRLNAENQNRAAERRMALMQQPVDPAAAGAPGTTDALAAQLARARQELAQLRTQYSEKYPDIARVKAEIASLERQLAERGPLPKTPDPRAAAAAESTRRQSSALAFVEADVHRLKAEEQRIREAIALYQRRVDDAPAREQEFQELSRDYETTRELYRSLLGRYEEAVIAESMEQRRTGEVFRVVDPATPAEQPVAPNRPKLVLLALALALGLGVAAAIVAEQFDTSFHSVEALRAFTSVTVAAAIPLVVTEGDITGRRRRLRLAAAGAAVGLTLIATAAYWLGHGNELLVTMLTRKA
jgi:succinoglycan biosynthesis transport protein ExoP